MLTICIAFFTNGPPHWISKWRLYITWPLPDLHLSLSCFFYQTPSAQASFVKDVCSLVGVIEEMGNPFEEESQDLVILDTKNIAGPAAVHIPSCIEGHFLGIRHI